MRMLAAISLVVLIGCGSSGSGGPGTCIAERFVYQPARRFPVGSTYFLPMSAEGCFPVRWTLQSAPAQERVQPSFFPATL